MADMQTYSGGCHCGRVRYEVATALSPVMSCNCSICQKRGYMLTYAIAYIGDFLIDFHIMGETYETTVPWSKIHDVVAAVFLDADGEDVRMLQQEQRVGNAIGLALLHKPALQLEPVRVGNQAEPPHVEITH